MKALGTAFCVLIVLFLIGQIRLGCKAEYDENGVVVFLRIGKLHIRIFPFKKKADKPKKPKAKKKPKQPVPMQQKIGGALGYAQALLPVLLDAVKYFWKKLRIDRLHMRLTAGSSDPAEAAMLYGQASAALGALWTGLTKAFDVKDGYAKVDLDFEAGEMRLCCAAALSLKLGQILWLAMYFGIWALHNFLVERSRQKTREQAKKGGLTHGNL